MRGRETGSRPRPQGKILGSWGEGPGSSWAVPRGSEEEGGHSEDWRDSCFSKRLMTWCTNWYCSHVWIIPPLS